MTESKVDNADIAIDMCHHQIRGLDVEMNGVSMVNSPNSFKQLKEKPTKISFVAKVIWMFLHEFVEGVAIHEVHYQLYLLVVADKVVVFHHIMCFGRHSASYLVFFCET